jgi:prevent-host-death family protein
MTRSPATASTVGAHDAKTNLSQLLDRVERGEAIVIVRHGEPVARLVPFEEPIDKAKVDQAIERLLALQKRHTLGDDLSVEDLINEGRES